MIIENFNLGPYLVRKELGRGVTAQVFYGWDPRTNTPVALKVLNRELARNAGAVAMFEEEGRIGLSIDSPQVVKTLMSARQGEDWFIAFEYIHGMPLARRIEKGPLQEAEAIWVLRHVAQALRELARKSIVHQDLKPENILLEKSGNCKLTDLGFARMKGGRINWDGYSAGTAFYMSPEQCQPHLRLPIDSRSDLYALGAVIYHAATGAPPFPGNEDEKVRELQIRQPAVPPIQRNPALSSPFSDLVTRMLSKNPGDRVQSPEELLLEMRQLPVKAAPAAVSISEDS